MGLLNAFGRMGRKVRAFEDGARWAGDTNGNPLAMGAGLSIPGGLIGAGMNPNDPGGGYLQGAALGFGAGAGGRTLGNLANMVRGGLERVAQQIPFEGPGFEAAKQQILRQIEESAGGELFASHVYQAAHRARNADELFKILQGFSNGRGAQLGDLYGGNLV